MADILQKVENIAVLALLAGIAYLAYKFLTGQGTTPSPGPSPGNCCTGLVGLPGYLCNLGAFVTGGSCPAPGPTPPGPTPPPDDDDPVKPIVYDSHGCEVGLMEWCETLKHCMPLGLTCPRDVEPVDPPKPHFDEHGCEIGKQVWCPSLAVCTTEGLRDPAFFENVCVIHEDEEEEIVKQLNDQCYYKGFPVLNVPPGTNCAQAINIMCDRFGPGTFNGKNWCEMAGRE